MNSAVDRYGQFVFIAIGVYCIYRGIMILTTGKLSEREEARLSAFPENGKRKFMMLNAFINIAGGVLVAAVSILRILNVINVTMLRILLLVLAAVLLIIYIIGRNSCKNAK